MSWFDTSGFASLAKTALKEAQKTIDKALDIKDEDRANPAATAAAASVAAAAPQTAAGTSPDFFDSWELNNPGTDKEQIIKMNQNPAAAAAASTSIWGSFTGSFFENPKGQVAGMIENVDRLACSKSFPESLSDLPSRTPPKSDSLDKLVDRHIHQDKQQERGAKKKEQNASLNRLSVLSTESSDNPTTSGSESVKVLSLQSQLDSEYRSSSSSSSSSNTDWTNSPADSSAEVDSKRKPVNSESVEILPHDGTGGGSLVTSPSSVEVINDDWRNPADESPYLSPMDENLSVWNLESDGEDIKSSTSTLEGSQQLQQQQQQQQLASTSLSWRASRSLKDDQEETSQADDSYASASDSTLLLSCAPESSPQSSCPDCSSQSLDSSFHRQIEAITTQPIRKSETSRLVESCSTTTTTTTTIEPASDADADDSTIECDDGKSENLARSSGSEQQQQFPQVLTDSSCEDTLVGSLGSEDNNNKMPSLASSSSFYVKSMLAEAMSDKTGETTTTTTAATATTTTAAATTATTATTAVAEKQRDNSPISSGSRSDLVKIGGSSDPGTSGHTSGDELETTTSSDIEIISSPNGGDSTSCCSTQSRQSPAKKSLSAGGPATAATDLLLLTRTLKTRGHSRELSEISVGSSSCGGTDDCCGGTTTTTTTTTTPTNLEVERLLRRIRETSEILEARESKLIEVSRSNMELHEQNASLKRQLDNVEKQQDINQITDEYTQRLSALERKFQQAIRERDSLRKALEQMKQEAVSRLSSAEIEKDEIIKELREEGDKLSKQQLQLNNIIKKLRAKEKENDALLKGQKEQMEEQSIELERLKRSLHAKEEVERNQIEAVHALTTKSRKQEKEILSLGEQLDHVSNKMEAYKASFDAAKAELIELKAKFADANEELKLATENAGESHQLLSQVEDLKSKLRLMEESHASREKLLKQENFALLKRLEAAESRNEEMSESVSQATIPLLRQIEQLQSSLTYKSNAFLRQEEAMADKVADLQSKLETTSEINRSLGEENANLKSRCSVLESKLSSRDADKIKYVEALDALKESNRKLADETQVHKHAMKMLEEAHATEIKELKREISSLENKLSVEKAATEAEKRKNNDKQTVEFEDQQQQQQQQRYSPSLDMERESVSSSTSSNWPAATDAALRSLNNELAMFDSSSVVGRFPPNSTSMIETLQAQLKQREGEVQQLQWELSRRNIERDALNSEVSLLASKVEDLNSALAELETIKVNLNDIQTKYDALLQMYGEKVEENQELQLDLLDVKEMYKTQIDQLLQRDR